MHRRIDLSAGAINGSDRLSVELIEPLDSPPIVAINWPPKPTVCDPRRFPDTAAAIVRMYAEAARTLAGIRATRRPRGLTSHKLRMIVVGIAGWRNS